MGYDANIDAVRVACQYFNLVWCFAITGWGLTCAAIALLPKLVAVPASVNKMAMMVVSAASLTVSSAYIYIAFTMTVEAEGATANLSGTLGAFNIISLVLLLVSILVHREPSTGEKAMF